MRFKIGQHLNRLTFVGRLLLLAISFFLFLILNTVATRAQTSDDHGNSLSNATNLPLGTSVAGRINSGEDVDVFRLDLSSRTGTTDVWIYTTGDFDSWGELYDSTGTLILLNDDGHIDPNRYNFHIRQNLVPGVYYIGVYNADYVSTGDYTLHAVAVTDPGSTATTATILNLDSPTGGSIGTPSNVDFFSFGLTDKTNLYLYARSASGDPVDASLYDNAGRLTDVNYRIWDDGFVIRDDFDPGTYYIKVLTPSFVTSHPVPYTIHGYEDVAYTDFISNCVTNTQMLSDPQINDSLFGCQWHLNNALGEDINVEPVWWDGLKGEGINIAVVDDGMDWSHEDLVDNVNESLNYDYFGYNDIHHRFEHHGTNVAGVIAARDNGVGVRGVAPRANIYGYNLVSYGVATDADDANAMALNRAITAISNNSWGPPDGPAMDTAGPFWRGAVTSGVNDGYNRSGVFYVWAAGNGHKRGDNSNLDGLANFYAVTAVCAVNDGDIRASYSELGANLWICAPSGEGALLEHREIVTTENSDRYTADFSGTSAATPIVSGVAALMRQANPNLTWRDLKLILAASARKNDPMNTGWADGAQKYGSSSASDIYHFNHEYGFGVVDAKAAVDMAKTWSYSLPPLQNSTMSSGGLNIHVPDPPIGGFVPPITHSLTLTSNVDFIEFVEVNVTFDHPSFRDLEIVLTSPSGATSTLAVPYNTFTDDDDPSNDNIPLRGQFRFGSARHLGENPNGEWRLQVTDHLPFPSAGGIFSSWSIKVYGHTGTPTATSACVTEGAVANPPTNPGLVSDCETMLDARDTLVGTGTALNWSASTPMSNWNGVTVEGTPERVTEISLQNKGLRGAIPTQLGSLTELKALRLSTTLEVCQDGTCRDTLEHEQNQLTGPIPSELGSLSKLGTLTVSRNQLTGPIPMEIRNINSLSLLGLGGNQLSGSVPSWLGNLTALEGLFLWGNEFTGHVPTELTSLTSLQWLELGSNQLSGSIPVGLGNLASLGRLTLHENQLSGQIPSELGTLSNLSVLSVWGNQLTGPIPPQLGGLSSLERLSLSQNQLSGTIPADLGNLSNLTVLSLWSNQLTGPIPPQLGGLSSLERLYLSQNQLSGTIPAELGNLSNLTVLSLWSNQLTGMVPASLVRLTNLEKLYLSQNQLTGCIPAGLQNVPTNDLPDVALPFCVQPSVTLSKTSPDAPIRINSIIQVTATFSEPVNGFEMADVVLANGLVSSFVGSDGDSVFTFDVTPNAIGVVTVDVAQDAAMDSEGNGNTAAGQLRLGMPYDDDNDGNINGIEVLNGVRDYFLGILNAQQILKLVSLYFSSPG